MASMSVILKVGVDSSLLLIRDTNKVKKKYLGKLLYFGPQPKVENIFTPSCSRLMPVVGETRTLLFHLSLRTVLSRQKHILRG